MEDKEKNKEGFIPKHGGYRNLITYQKSEIIYDGTKYFTNRAFKIYDRTIDQMVQAARSGKQKHVFLYNCIGPIGQEKNPSLCIDHG